MAGALTAAIAAAFSGSAVVPDPYFEYTTLLLPGNGTNGAQNNTFLDGSTNNFTITRNGNTTQGTFSPFSQTGWGNYFDGTGDYLTTPNNAALTLGSGDFTIEMWIFCPNTANGNIQILYDQRSASGQTVPTIYLDTNGYLQYFVAGANKITYSTAVTSNAWNHIAISRSGSNTIMFLNGAQVGSTYTTLDTLAGNAVGIGAYLGTPSLYYTGYMSNLRVVKGVAVYTGTFTPPTSPLAATQSAGTNISAITGTQTSLLTCQSNRFIDNSTNNFTITRNGDTRVVAFSPFNPTASWSAATYGGSGYFDGNGDYLVVPSNSVMNFGTGDFTIEAWVYPTATPGDGAGPIAGASGDILLGYQLSGNSWGFGRNFISWEYLFNQAPILNTWQHLAVSRSVTTLRLFFNGALVNTATSSTSYNLTNASNVGFNGTSGYLTGYITNIRAVKGTAVYTSAFTPPTAPLTAITNTSLLLNFTNAGIYDATSKNDLETVGDAQLSNTTAKWGSTSIKFDGAGSPTDSLLVPASQNLTFGSGDFTIEMWIYSGANATTTRTMGNIAGGTWSSGKWVFATATPANPNKFTFAFNNYGTDIVSTTSSNDSAWHHVAISRSGSSIRLFVDGNLQATGISSASLDNGVAAALTIGGSGGAGEFWAGYIQDLRITKGYARYTANFTAPTAAFPTL